MHIPNTINKNSFNAYKPVEGIYKRNGKLQSDNFNWDAKIIGTLRQLCLKAIANNWEFKQIYSELLVTDRLEMVDYIPCKIPLKLTISKIDDDHYWQRYFFIRWPDSPPPNQKLIFTEDTAEESSESNNNSELNTENNISTYESLSESLVYSDRKIKTWKTCFAEKYLEEAIENVKPTEYDPEYMKEMTDVYGPYVLSLNIRQLKCGEPTETRNHISIHTLLTGLPNLLELSVCFIQGILTDKHSWYRFEIAQEDCDMLARGLEKSRIKILRIIRCDISNVNLQSIIDSSIKVNSIRILDFTNSKIGDDGMILICELLKKSSIEIIELVNSQIGKLGACELGSCLLSPTVKVSSVNLRLNPLGLKGGSAILNSLKDGAKNLKALCISACCLSIDHLAINEILQLNRTLLKLDLSNNLLSKNFGENLLSGLQNNNTITNIDLRMCGIPQDLRLQIEDMLERNLKQC